MFNWILLHAASWKSHFPISILLRKSQESAPYSNTGNEMTFIIDPFQGIKVQHKRINQGF